MVALEIATVLMCEIGIRIGWRWCDVIKLEQENENYQEPNKKII